MLEQKVEIFLKEFSVLKDLFLVYVGNVVQLERVIEVIELRVFIFDYQYSLLK